jgi:hypothetical protein
VNDAPTISAIPAQSVPENTPLEPVAFTIGDVDSDIGTLSVTASSSDQAIVPDASLVLGGSGATRTIAATPRTAVRGDRDHHVDGQRWQRDDVDDVHAVGHGRDVLSGGRRDGRVFRYGYPAREHWHGSGDRHDHVPARGRHDNRQTFTVAPSSRFTVAVSPFAEAWRPSSPTNRSAR